MRDLNLVEKTVLKDNLRAFNANFEQLTIKYNNGYYFVYQNPNEEFDNWLYSTDIIEELNGFLEGAVKAKHKRFKELTEIKL